MEKKLTASMADFITNVRRNTQMNWTEIYAALNTVYHFVSDAYDPGAALAKMYKRYMDANAPKPVKETPKPKYKIGDIVHTKPSQDCKDTEHCCFRKEMSEDCDKCAKVVDVIILEDFNTVLYQLNSSDYNWPEDWLEPEVKAEPKDDVDEVLSKMSPLELMLVVLACDEILDDLDKQIAVIDRIRTMPTFPFLSLLF